MRTDPHLELAPLAAIDALDGEDRTAFASHAAGCPGCQAEVAAHEEVAARIGLALPPVQPSPWLRRRVLAAAAATPEVQPAVRRRNLVFPGLAAAAAVVLGVALLLTRSQRDEAERQGAMARQEAKALQDEVQQARQELADLRSRLDGERPAGNAAALEAELSRARAELAAVRAQLSSDVLHARQTADALTTEVQRVRGDLATARQRVAEERALNDVLAHPDARVAQLQGLDAAPRAHGRVVWNPATREAVLIASGLDPAPSGKAYEVWVIAQSAPVPAGVFQVDAQGRAVFHLPVVDDTARVKTFAVTLEPAAGTPAPTGAMVLAGNVS